MIKEILRIEKTPAHTLIYYRDEKNGEGLITITKAQAKRVIKAILPNA
jgi:hypothetical protein